MKFYLWSFREYGAHCEILANKISNEIKDVTKAKYAKVIVEQRSRGGLKLKSKVEL